MNMMLVLPKGTQHGKGRMLHHHLIFIAGMMLVYGETSAFPRCSVKERIAYYNFCNLTWVPPVPENIISFFLNSNYIQEVDDTSFPLLKQLEKLFLGTQSVSPVTIRGHTFKNLPNLRELDLAGNKMIVLDSSAFRGLVNLRKLWLYYNGLNELILEEAYFQDLVSLEYLNLEFNKITRLRPHPLFYKMKYLNTLELKLNSIGILCEGDLDSFQGKTFKLFALNSVKLYKQNPVNWTTCGNPFKNIVIDTLDVGGNGWDVAITQQFCSAIQGTPILTLKLSSHTMGSSFGFNNSPNPDNNTFIGLAKSGLRLLNISKGFIFALNPYVFQRLGSLEGLDLSRNEINRIEKQAFFGLWTLTHLNVSHNLLGELVDDTFVGLFNLVSLDLQNNHIGVVTQGTFKYLTRLQELNLKDNALRLTPSFPNLFSLSLSGNRLKYVGSSNLIATSIDLDENRLENLSDLYKLLQIPVSKFIFLKNNRFSYCDAKEDVPENNQLLYLDLGNNMLKLIWERNLCLNVFKALIELKILHLNNNYLNYLPEGIFSGLVSLYRLNLDSNLLTYLPHNAFPKSLKILQLSANHLLYPDPQIFATLDYLDLTNNMFYCNCLLSSLIVWLNQTNVTLLGLPEEMFCFGPHELAGTPLYELNVDSCNEDKVLESLQLSLFIFTCVALTVFLVAVIIFTRFRGTSFICYKTIARTFFKELQPDPDKKTYQYDAYICYSGKDFEWVQHSLIRRLDSQYSDQNRFSLCFEERDFLPGSDHISNIRDAIWNCRKTICVVTKHFLTDGWCVEAFNFAQSRYYSDLKDVLIMVVAGSLSQYHLMKYPPIRAFLQRGRYLRWPEDQQDVEWFLSSLSHRILKEKEVKKKSRSLELKIITVS
ncbi:hypothetical protein JRQ81_004709 [Phrynocephalus forsythii]|uniref:TIR domain-containing protein n=1 Tax=Phrynocephalus forsythii TaxID=171643 RepID=A0A9Q0Y277_9SAUR|nr:hypothetical protein JRQ81_004709 [Phrynocephalus forsythii]